LCGIKAQTHQAPGWHRIGL